MKAVFFISLALLFYVYAGYPLLIYFLGKLRGKMWRIDDNYFPTVSIIVPAYNEEACIAQKIENGLALDYPKDKLEISVSSDCSSDRTGEIVAVYANKYPDLVKFNDFKKRRGKMGVLNDTVPHTQGEILIFTDANSLFDAKAVKKLVRHLTDPKIGCVSGAKVIAEGKEHSSKGEGLYWRFEAFVKKYESRLSSCAGADGSIYAVRRELYPYPPDREMIMDDFAVSLSVIMKGYRCVFDAEARAYEESPTDLKSELKRKARILAGAITALRHMKEVIMPGSPVFVQIWSHKILRWSSVIFMVAFLISNIFLAGDLLYQGFLVAQGIFYSLAVMGFVLTLSGNKNKIFYVPFYFCFFSLTQPWGLVVYFRDRRSAAWEKLRK